MSLEDVYPDSCALWRVAVYLIMVVCTYVESDIELYCSCSLFLVVVRLVSRAKLNRENVRSEGSFLY